LFVKKKSPAGAGQWWERPGQLQLEFADEASRYALISIERAESVFGQGCHDASLRFVERIAKDVDGRNRLWFARQKTDVERYVHVMMDCETHFEEALRRVFRLGADDGT